MRSALLLFVLVLLSAGSLWAVESGWHTIHNDFYWVDQAGERLYTRSGCLVKFGELYYWYGGTQRDRHQGQYCYTSPDLVHWTNHGKVIQFEVEVNRIDVVQNPKTKQVVMIMKYDGNGAHLGIATADKPEGPFTFQGKMLVDEARMGDSSVYVDDDGTAYLCYVSWAVGTNAQHGIYRMSDDYLTLDERVFLWDIRSREAPHILKRNGLYYYGTSRTAGIESSGTRYYTAKDLAGPWSRPESMATPGSRNSWDSQVDMIVPIEGTEGKLYLYFGDRWVQDLPKGRNGDYIFLPMEFEGDKPILNYYQDWEINIEAGTWRTFDAGRNLAAGKTMTASSQSDPNHAADQVVTATTYADYVNSYWQSGEGDAQWIMVDLGEPMEVNRVILKWGTNAAKAFTIQTSVNGSDWTDVFATEKGASYTVTDETFATTTAKYVRMTATQRAPVPQDQGFERRQDSAGSTAQGSGYTLFDFMVLRD